MALLEVQDVTVRFGGVVAVDDVSLGVEEGRVAGLIGPNGAGKTTMFNVVTGLLQPTEGTVTVDGRPITDLDVHERARLRIARTFQRLEVFGSLTVRENVLTAADIHARWASDPPEAGEVTEAILARTGLEAFADQPADSVPTGIARLTELGRALAIDPRLLLLDEPSSGLNEDETRQLGDLLVELAAEEGRGVLLVEHDVDLVMRVCEWIDVLDNGRHIASGSAQQVREDPEVQAAYLGQTTEDAA